jgi:hypothetical protein
VEVTPGVGPSVPAGLVPVPAVELDDEPAPEIDGVAVDRVPRDVGSHLTVRPGQTVGALDVSEVAVLQHRLDAAPRLVEQSSDQVTTPEPRP